jgi:transposase
LLGAWFLFLPPYSPDLNPIEMAFTVAVISTVRDYSRLGHVPRKKAA